MKKAILNCLKKHRSKLIEALNDVSDEQDNALESVISFVASAVLYLWYSLINGIIFKLEGVLICFMYCSEYDKGSSYMTFVRMIAENKEKLDPLLCEEDKNTTYLVFYSNKLKRLSQLFKHDKELRELYDKVINGYVSTCIHCGCGILGPFPYTYRDHGGCVGKTSECYVCRDYTNKGVREIQEYRNKYGTEAAIIKAANDGFEEEEEC